MRHFEFSATTDFLNKIMIHTVSEGETLANIAAKYGSDWQTVQQMNSDISNPNLIYVGQQIKIPDGSTQSNEKIPAPDLYTSNWSKKLFGQ